MQLLNNGHGVKRSWIACAVWMCLAIACLPGAVQARELLAVGTSFASVFEKTPSGEFVGLGVELVQALARQQGDSVKFEIYPWARAQEMVARGQADVLVGPYKTEKREQLFAFMALPFYQDNMVFYTRAGSAAKWDGSVDSLRGKRIVAVLGWVYGEPFDTVRAALNVANATTVENGLAMLQRDRMDFFAANERNAAAGIAAYGSGNDIVLVRPFIGREVGYIALPKDAAHQQMQRQFNQSFDSLIASGAFMALASRFAVTVPDAVAARASVPAARPKPLRPARP